MTAELETVFDLAREALDKRESHDEDCDGGRAAVAKATRYVKSLCRMPKRAGLAVPDDVTITTDLADEEDVRAKPGEWHCVAAGLNHNAAYQERKRWLARGFYARSRTTGTAYAVDARTNEDAHAG